MTAVVRIGGISIGVQGAGVEQVPTPSRPFLVDDPNPEVLCTGGLGPVQALENSCQLFDSGGVWRVDELGGGGIRLVLRSGPHPGRPYHLLDLSSELDRGRVTLDDSQLADGPAPFLLRAPLHELWTSFLLLRGRGALVHACGLLAEDQAHLFAGASGAGKSTLASILEGRYGTILSDDRIILRPEPGGFRAYGTPWQGEARFACPQSGQLRAVHFLAHAPQSECIRLGRADAAARLASCCFMACWPRQGISDLLALCVKVVQNVPCYELGFVPDESAARAAGLEPVS